MSPGMAMPIVSLSEVQAFVRVETGEEEALLAGFIRTASALCESFLNLVVVARPFSEVVEGSDGFQRLQTMPVRCITDVICANGSAAGTPLDPTVYSVDVDHLATGWVRLPQGARYSVNGVAGIAVGQSDVPEPIRQGVVRLTAHLFGNRDGGGEPPAVVTALWRPYRRLVLA